MGFSRSYHCTVDVVLCYILCDWCRSCSSQWPCWSWFVPYSGWCWRSGGVWLAQLWSWLVAQTRQPTWPGCSKHSDSIWSGFCFSLLLLCSVSVRMLAQRWTGKPNSLAAGRCGNDGKSVFSEQVLQKFLSCKCYRTDRLLSARLQ